MSEREFELYLSVLSRLLRLTPAQRDEIADELRDDLESRFNDLCQQGFEREAAIRKAIEELGDASGLAGHFTEIARQRKRRFIMRLSLTGTMALVLILVGLQAFLPQNNLVNPQPAHAQFGGGGPGGGAVGGGLGVSGDWSGQAGLGVPLFAVMPRGPLPDRISIQSSSEFGLPEGLSQPIEGAFKEVPLGDALKVIANATDVPVFIDRSAIVDELGVDDPSEELTVSCRGELPAFEMLNLICQSAGGDSLDEALVWETKLGTVWITTASAAREPRYTRTVSYDLAELLQTGIDPETVQNMVRTMTRDARWQDVDGEGGMLRFVGSTLNVRHTAATHRRVGALLEALAQHSTAKAPDRTRTTQTGNEAGLADLLGRRMDLSFKEVPLSELVEKLREMGLPMYLDQRSLREEDVDLDTLVTFSAKGQPLDRALTWMLQSHQLHVVPDGRTLMIRHDAHTKRSVVLYNVREVVSDLSFGSEIVDAVQSMVPGPWEAIDGEGSAIEYSYPGVLAVLQTDAGHRDIEALLAFHRESRKRIAAVKREDDKTIMEPRMYAINTGAIVGWDEGADPAQIRELEKVITEFVAPATWVGQGGKGSMRWLGNKLIVNQTRDVHRQVSVFLRRTSAASETVPFAGGGFGGAGGYGGGLGGGGMGGMGGGMGGGGGFF